MYNTLPDTQLARLDGLS